MRREGDRHYGVAVSRSNVVTISMAILLYSGNFGLGHEPGTALYAVYALNGDVNMKLLLVGGGRGLPEIRRLVAQLELTDVEFRPPVPLYRLPQLLAEGDIHLVAQNRTPRAS